MGGQIVTYFLGQCGNQIGQACWELYCLEHCISPDGHFFDDNVPSDNSFYNFFLESHANKYVPRTILLDLEPSVIDEIKLGPYRQLFHSEHIISGYEDAANNFARGFYSCAKSIVRSVVKSTRKVVEACDDVQAFMVHHSFGGGTGSGFMAMLLEYLSVEFNKSTKVEFGVFPSPTLSTSIVEPYNAVLALHTPMENADVAAFFENESLFKICDHNLGIPNPRFTHLNRMGAQVISGMTASLRFEGPINANLIDFQTNLVPYPRIHFPLVSFAPFMNPYKLSHESCSAKQITIGASLRENQMTDVDPLDGAYMSCCLLYRGDINLREVNTVINHMKADQNMRWVDWCPTGYKVGMNYQPMIAIPTSGIAFSARSLTLLANSTAIKVVIGRLNHKFMMMYDRKAFIHWYVGEGMEEEEFREALEDVSMLVKDLEALEESAACKMATDQPSTQMSTMLSNAGNKNKVFAANLSKAANKTHLLTVLGRNDGAGFNPALYSFSKTKSMGNKSISTKGKSIVKSTSQVSVTSKEKSPRSPAKSTSTAQSSRNNQWNNSLPRFDIHKDTTIDDESSSSFSPDIGSQDQSLSSYRTQSSLSVSNNHSVHLPLLSSKYPRPHNQIKRHQSIPDYIHCNCCHKQNTHQRPQHAHQKLPQLPRRKSQPQPQPQPQPQQRQSQQHFRKLVPRSYSAFNYNKDNSTNLTSASSVMPGLAGGDWFNDIVASVSTQSSSISTIEPLTDNKLLATQTARTDAVSPNVEWSYHCGSATALNEESLITPTNNSPTTVVLSSGSVGNLVATALPSASSSGDCDKVSSSLTKPTSYESTGQIKMGLATSDATANSTEEDELVESRYCQSCDTESSSWTTDDAELNKRELHQQHLALYQYTTTTQTQSLTATQDSKQNNSNSTINNDISIAKKIYGAVFPKQSSNHKRIKPNLDHSSYNNKVYCQSLKVSRVKPPPSSEESSVPVLSNHQGNSRVNTAGINNLCYNQNHLKLIDDNIKGRSYTTRSQDDVIEFSSFQLPRNNNPTNNGKMSTVINQSKPPIMQRQFKQTSYVNVDMDYDEINVITPKFASVSLGSHANCAVNSNRIKRISLSTRKAQNEFVVGCIVNLCDDNDDDDEEEDTHDVYQSELL